MDTRTVALVPVSIIALMIGASIFALFWLPVNALVPTHFNLSGKPDAFGPPVVAFSLLPAVAIAGLPILMLVVRKAEGGGVRPAAALRIAGLAPLFVLAVTHGLVIAYTLGVEVNVTRVLILVVGLTLIGTGNVLGKVRSNCWIGIRTPWTLRDERVWDRTHRFGGWIFVGAGTALALSALVIPAGPVLGAVLFAMLSAVVIVPSVKSYLLWRNRENI